MWTDIAVFGGIVGAVVAIVCIFVIYSIKRSINTILDRDLVLFDQNFEIKKKSLTTAFEILDEIADFGNEIKLNSDFSQKVETCYNDLLCVMGNISLAEEFYFMAVDPDFDLTQTKVAEFKLACRKDIGLNNKGSQILSKISNHQKNSMGETETLLRAKSVNNSNLAYDTFITSQPTTQNSRTIEQPATPTSNQTTRNQPSNINSSASNQARATNSNTQRPTIMNRQSTSSPATSNATRPVSSNATHPTASNTTTVTRTQTQTTTSRPNNTTRTTSTTTTTTRPNRTGSNDNN